MTVDKIKNGLFVLIGVIAFINSMSRHINREDEWCLLFQLFAFTMIVIGGCNLYKLNKGDDK